MAKSTGSMGLFKQMAQAKKQERPTAASEKKQEIGIKRSYTLQPDTIKKLQELKVFVYADPAITYNEIVDEAINILYGIKKLDKK